MNVLYTCEFALLVGGEGLLGLLLELLGSSRAGTVPLLRLQRPREALEQRAPCNTSTFTFFSFDSGLICGARSTECQVNHNYIFFKSFRLMAGILISFVNLRISLWSTHYTPILSTQNQNIWPETTENEPWRNFFLMSYFLQSRPFWIVDGVPSAYLSPFLCYFETSSSSTRTELTTSI